VLSALVTLSLGWAAAPAAAADAPVAGTLDVTRLAGPGLAAAGSDAVFLAGPSRNQAGSSVAFVGDFNGDGRQDYAIGMQGAGEVDVVYGAAFPELAPLALPLDRGVRIRGTSVRSRAGASVAGAGDVNGDGLGDLLIGAPGTSYANRADSGAAWVVFGSADAPELSLRSPGTRAVRILGAAGDGLGSAVASVGDLDGDGRRELAVGAAGGSAAYVVYSATLGSGVDLAAPAGRAYRIGGTPGERAGAAVAGVDDMNGDGLGEVLVGAPAAGGGAGAAFAVWGRPPPAAAPVDLAALGTQGFAMLGSGGEQAGTAVAGMGDATGDGRPDIAVGAPLSSWNGRPKSGAAYVVPGRADSATAVLPADGVRVGGGDPGERLGGSLAAAGDIDRDGLADLAIGLSFARTLGRGRSYSAILLLTGRIPRPDVDGGLLGYAAIRLAGPPPGASSGPALAGGADVDGDGRADMLMGFPFASDYRGEAALVRVPAPSGRPATPPPAAPVLATNVEAVVDDSGSMGRYDPGGVLRRQALELMLTNPANQGRIFGAVEFGTWPHQIVPPLPIGGDAAPDRLEVLRSVLAERVANDGGTTNFAGALIAAGVSNPDAQARIFITDGGQLGGLEGFGGVPTYVIGLKLVAGPARTRLEQLAHDSGGAFYPARDGGELQAALAAIDARLRGELPLATTVAASPGVRPLATAAEGEAAAAVSSADAAVGFQTSVPTVRARTLRRARMVISWNKGGSSFELVGLRFRTGAGATVRVPAGKLRRALTGRWQRLRRGLEIRGRVGLTFIALDVRGIGGGRRAVASAQGWGASSRVARTKGGGRAVVRSLWTYQRRPT
jgi:hypothetical protein